MKISLCLELKDLPLYAICGNVDHYFNSTTLISDDQFLITFLRANKYSLQKAKEKLDLFWTVREEVPELMKKRDPLDKRIGAMLKLG